MRILVLCGGDSSEHQISINSARNIIKYLDNYDVWYIKNHKFYKTCGILDNNDLKNSLIVENLNDIYNYDIVFPVLHGKQIPINWPVALLSSCHLPVVFPL